MTGTMAGNEISSSQQILTRLVDLVAALTTLAGRTVGNKAMNAQAIVKALGGTWCGSYGTACCPAHDDREPSLSIRDGVGGEPVFHCFAGCDWRDIKDMLRARGLLPERDPGHAPQRRHYRKPEAPKPRPDDSDQQQRVEFARQKWREAVSPYGQPSRRVPARARLGAGTGRLATEPALPPGLEARLHRASPSRPGRRHHDLAEPECRGDTPDLSARRR